METDDTQWAAAAVRTLLTRCLSALALQAETLAVELRMELVRRRVRAVSGLRGGRLFGRAAALGLGLAPEGRLARGPRCASGADRATC